MKNRQPLVSILIPVYNSEKWIDETINSALKQTWPQKEIIMVDDGSSDKSFYIAKKFESNSLKVIRQENMGASSARNKALSLAQGEYIQWLDSDDLLFPDKIFQQMKQVEAFSDSRLLFSSVFGTFYRRTTSATYTPTSLWLDLRPVDWLVRKFSENIWLMPAAWLVSRELTQSAGPWNENLSLDDDGEYFSRVVAASKYVKFVPEAKSLYRQWSTGSLSRTTSVKALKSLLLSLKLCVQHLLKLEDSEKTRNACVKHLQTWFGYFYPEHEEYARQLEEIAQSLGGNLHEPEISGRYRVIKDLFGWPTAKKVRRSVRSINMLRMIKWDEIMYRFSYKNRDGLNAK